jgi:hypothetical protein
MRSGGEVRVGPGDLAVAQLEREERDAERRLRGMTRDELVTERICPECRGKQCEVCNFTGEIVVCTGCGDTVPPGSQTIIPINVDRPRDGVDEFCSVCAAKEPS